MNNSKNPNTVERVEVTDSVVDDKFYNIVMFNDDVTPVEYVMLVMILLFQHEPGEAMHLIDQIQIEGEGVVFTTDRETAYMLCDMLDKMNNDSGMLLQVEPREA